MKRYDLRHLKDDFYDRMVELIDKGINVGEVGIFLFEVGDFSSIQKSADVVRATGNDLLNSLKFNEVDWTVVVKKVDEATKTARTEKIAAAKIAAEAKAKEDAEKEAVEAKAKEEAQKAEADAKAKEEAEAKAKAEKAAAKPTPVKKAPAKKPAVKKPATKPKAK